MNPKWCMKKETVKKTVSLRSFFFHASVRVHKIISVFGEKFHLTQIHIFHLFCLFIQTLMFLSLSKPETLIVKTKAMHKKIGEKFDIIMKQ